MPESSPHWSGKSPLPLTCAISASPLLAGYYLLLTALALVCCALLPADGIAGVLRLAAPLPCAAWGLWLAAVHGLRRGAQAITGLTVLPSGDVRLGFGDGRSLLLDNPRAHWAHPLCIVLRYPLAAAAAPGAGLGLRPRPGMRMWPWHRRTLVIPCDSVDGDTHRALRALLQRADD